MKAIVCEAWGLPDTLVVRDLPEVVPDAGKVGEPRTYGLRLIARY